jgi:hypothetical protein
MSVGFLEKLRSFKRDEVPERITKALDKFISETPELDKEEVKRSNAAAFSLVKWAYAILNYAKVAKEVEPRTKLADMMQ